MALVLRVRVDTITIYPFGGITKIDSVINIPIYKEFLISIGGFLFQLFYY